MGSFFMLWKLVKIIAQISQYGIILQVKERIDKESFSINSRRANLPCVDYILNDEIPKREQL